MRKILIFSLAYYPKHVGGAEVAIKQITDRIARDDVEFHMVTLRFDSTLPKVEQVGNVLVHRIGFSRENPSPEALRSFPLHLNKYLYQVLAYWKAHMLHVEHHYDGVWAMMAHATAVPTALFNIFHPRVPFVLTLQEGDNLESIEHKARPVWPLFARAFKKARVIQVISSYLGNWAKKMGTEGSVVVIPNGVDVEQFRAPLDTKEREVLRRKLGKSSHDVLLISTSRFVKKNAMDDVIASLEHLPRNIHLVLIGDGPLERELRSLALEKGVQARVTFVGYVPYEEIPKYLHACDIFIRPSRSEGMGNSFIEAMAAGLPVIATQEGGLRDFIFDDKVNFDMPMTAWAVPKDNPEAIARAVGDIVSYPEKVKTVTENARAFIADVYEWGPVTERMLRDVFSKL